MRDAGHRTAEKAKKIYPPPRGVDIIILLFRCHASDAQLPLPFFLTLLYTGLMSLSKHCVGCITMGSFKTRGNQYIQLVKILLRNCRTSTRNYKLSYTDSGGLNQRLQSWGVSMLPTISPSSPPPPPPYTQEGLTCN